MVPINGTSRSPRKGETVPMKKTTQQLIAEVPRRRTRVELTIGIDLGDVWSHYCTLNQDGEVVDRGRVRTTPKAIEKWFADVPHARVVMEAGVHSIWISEQLQELGHEVIVANVRELRAISHSDRKSDHVDAEKLAPLRTSGPQHSATDLPSYRRAAASTHPDSCASPAGPPTHGGGERRPWPDEVLRLSHARILHHVASPNAALPSCHRGLCTGAWSGASAHRGDDGQDQAV